MAHCCKYYYVQADGAELFTTVCLPEENGKFPTIVMRSPYVDMYENVSYEEICENRLNADKAWLDAGYATVLQHCRGRGKSSGDCMPYINEREDGLALHEWIRQQNFYNGELYLCGGSYCASVHYVTAPFADDIKGAVLEVQDPVRYNCNYRNGFYKMGLHGNWYPTMYKRKSIPNKNYVPESYNMLPLSDFSKAVLGEPSADFDEILRHPDKDDPFWLTRFGGGEARDAIKHANIPILLTTAFYDVYTGGSFDNWFSLDDATRAKSALVVNPYDHGGTPNKQPIRFEGGMIAEKVDNFRVKWMDFIRGKCESPFELGKVTYYKLFGDEWCCDEFDTPEKVMTFALGEGERTYCYNPYAPAEFKGGLSANDEANSYQDPPNSRYDILSFYTDEFDRDVFVKGKMSAKLRVKSDCEDTCFYMRLSITKPDGDYGLRDDINQISNFCADYVPGTEIDMDFSFDEHAFVVHKGERLRIDVSSSAFPHYVRHTNNKGLFSEQITAKIAHNTVICDKSSITLCVEEY